MSDERRPEFRAPQGSLRFALLVAAAAVAVLAFVLHRDSDRNAALSGAIETVARGVGVVVALFGVALLGELRRARSSDEVLRTVWLAAVAVLCGATLVTPGAWGPPLGAGAALVAAAIARRRRDGCCCKPGAPRADSSD